MPFHERRLVLTPGQIAMKTSTVETLVWVLIYGGLLGVGFGLAVQRYVAPLGWGIVATGVVVAIAGVVLIYVRSRMKSPT